MEIVCDVEADFRHRDFSVGRRPGGHPLIRGCALEPGHGTMGVRMHRMTSFQYKTLDELHAPVFHAPGFAVRFAREQDARNIVCLIRLDIMRAPSASGST